MVLLTLGTRQLSRLDSYNYKIPTVSLGIPGDTITFLTYMPVNECRQMQRSRQPHRVSTLQLVV